MYVKIGKYEDCVTPSTFTKKLDEVFNDHVIDKIDDILRPLCKLWNKRFWNKRKIKVRIDNYDVWSMDHTLALIIVPMLKKLKEQKHGSPFVDDADLPEQIRNITGDDAIHKKWDYVLDEMIWAFEQDALEDGWENQYYSGKSDFKYIEIEIDGKKYYELERSEKDTFKIDDEGIKKHRERMEKGRMLFAKYYNCLWD